MTNIKICGLKEIEHVQTAVQYGATMLGLVFAKSKRQVTIEQAQQLAAYIPPHIKKVGVFVNATKEQLIHTYEAVGLDYIQYHGDESPEFIKEVGLPSIKAFSVDDQFDFVSLQSYNVDYFLFDAPRGEYYGGNGTTFDWKVLQSNSIDSSKIIIAGGLNSQNVQEAIQLSSPFAVDVSSGVEINGRKNHQLIQQFIDTVKGVHSYE